VSAQALETTSTQPASGVTHTETVTVKNGTPHQVLGRPIVVVHKRGFQVFRTGTAASPALGRAAQDGDVDGLAVALRLDSRVRSVVIGRKDLRPGHATTVEVEVGPLDQISVISPLAFSNDAFAAVTDIDAPEAGTELRRFAFVFDAGTEANTERCEDIPACAHRDNAGGGGEGTVQSHPGIRGDADLPISFGWQGPVAEVIIGPDLAGQIEVPMGLNVTDAPGELILQEPSMCNGSAHATVTYSRAKNRVLLEADYTGVPLNLTASFPEDPSTQYNRFPQTVSNGAWQTTWLAYFGGRPTKIWYDAQGRLLGSKYSLVNGVPPPGSFAVETTNVVWAMGSPQWVPDANGHGVLRWELEYDSLRDYRDSAGLIIVFDNYVFGDDNSLGRLDFGGIPAEDAISFDEVLSSVTTRLGFAIGTHYEPSPRPEYLQSRIGTIAGWVGTYPDLFDPTPPIPCQTHILAPFPAESGNH